MKIFLIATATFSITIGAAFASQDSTSVEQMLRLSNDSAAERLLPETSTGDAMAARKKFAISEDSAAERDVLLPEEINAHSEDMAKEKFATSKDSAAEQVVHFH
ncbi:hypothetical protein PGB28_11915 [Primorskyibacter aestuariivivens]|uniref:hypothetical protein n=1 Tax=Primorskyibacter aestuariivivens TaxID=1888912 RepID=UPI0023018B6E|nr:hypothetical protein [Primorskyibacter aestuariivivens]MDA7429167.1 hypothetical protein [Primorskyibacter aestuariivivens]